MLTHKTRPASRFPLKSVLWNLLLALFCSMLYFSEVHAQEKCATLLKKAEEEYLSGKFNNTIELLNNCLQYKRLTKPERIRTYRLMALAYLGSGKPQEAEINVQRIFKLECRYQPDLTEMEQEFIHLVNKVSADLKCKDGNKKWLLLGGGGLAAASIIAAIILLNNDKNHISRFPDPPKQP
jgi:hypothetical protein